MPERFTWLLLTLALLATCPAQAQKHPYPIALKQGIVAGEISPSAVILQSRLTTASPYFDPGWSGVVGDRGYARFEIADRADFSGAKLTEWIEAIPENDFIVKAAIRGLKPATRYHYRLIYGHDKETTSHSEAATFRTLAGAGQDDKFSFAVVTGMNYAKFHHTGDGEDPTVSSNSPPYSGPNKHLGYPGLKAIVDSAADFFVATGDNVYYDTPRVGRAESLHEMRRKHQEQYSQQRFLDLFAKTGTYWMKDDHDHRFDDSDQVSPFIAWPGLLVKDRKPADTYPRENLYPLVTGSGFLPTHEMGVHVFREQLPVTDPQDPKAVTYRTHRVSKSLQIWFVEGRDYRSPNDMTDGPQKTIWGAEQKAWLKRTLLESDAAFKILFSPTPMVGPDGLTKRDNHVNPTGFRNEGDEFFQWLTANGFRDKNLYIVCGDRHWKYHAIHPSGFEEFSSGALIDANSLVGIRPGDRGSSDPDGLIRHPYHNEVATGGFLLITLNPGNPPTLEFQFQDEKGAELYTDLKRPGR